MSQVQLTHEQLKAYEGRPTGTAGVGKDLVNEPMIRHWCEAVGDANPAYRGPDAIAPPAMLQAWTMGGLSGHTDRSGAYGELSALLDDAGYTSIVATDCEQEYLRPLRPGDRITFDAVIESVSERKTTKLGTGHFLTTRMDIRANGDPAAPIASGSSSTPRRCGTPRRPSGRGHLSSRMVPARSRTHPSSPGPGGPAPSSTATTPASGKASPGTGC